MTFAFFRKYNKIILAVGGSLLMVIFLIPQVSFTMMSKPGDQVIGTIGEREILVSDRQMAAAEMELLRRISPEQIGPTLPSGNEGTLAWLLMLEEAKKQGLWSSRPEAISLLQALEVDPQLLATIKNDLGAGDDFLYRALRDWRMYMMVQEMVAGTRRPSEPELRRFARDVQSQVGVKVVGVPAETLLGEIEAPTEEELAERFALNRNDLPGVSEPYGFGYRLGPRVKLEYMAIPLERAKQAVNVDEVEAQRYYMEHPEEFLPPPEDGTASGEGEKEPLAYREVRQRIIDMLSERDAAQIQQQVAREALGLLNESVRRFARNLESGYIEIPEAAGVASMEDVAGQVQSNTGMLADVVRLEEEWISLGELAEEPGIGGAYLVVGSGENRRGVPVAGYLSVAKEFNPPENHPLGALKLQVGVPSAVMLDEAGSLYIVRLIAAEPARAASGLDEVREEVERDVKMLKAYGLLGQRAEEYAAKAREGGLEQVVADVGGSVEAQEIGLFTRRELNPQSMTLGVPNLAVVGQSQQFVDGVFKIAEHVEKSGKLEDVAAEERIGTVGVDRLLTVYVVEITEYEAVSAEMYAQLRPVLLRMMGQLDILEMQRSGYYPFTLEALASRVGFEAARTEGAGEEEEATGAGTVPIQ